MVQINHLKFVALLIFAILSRNIITMDLVTIAGFGWKYIEKGLIDRKKGNAVWSRGDKGTEIL